VVKEGPKCRALYMMLIECTAQISLSSKIYVIYIVHIYVYNTICRIITVEVYCVQNVLKDTIQVRNSGMSGRVQVLLVMSWECANRSKDAATSCRHH